MKVKDYKDLTVWVKGIDIVDKVYNLTGKFPREELFGLAAQMRKSAVSIPSNIAEGFGRHFTKEYTQFLHIALGSCAELETQTIISRRRNYITQTDMRFLQEALNHESRMLMSIIKHISKNEPRVTSHESQVTSH